MGKAMHRNDPCHCGSARKYKKCCLGKDENEVRDMIVGSRHKAAKFDKAIQDIIAGPNPESIKTFRELTPDLGVKL